MKVFTLLFLLLLLSEPAFSQKSDPFRNKRFFNITKFSYIDLQNAKLETWNSSTGTTATDLSVDHARVYSLQTIAGYFLNPYLSVGAGIGLDGYHEPTFNTMPFFIDVRGYFVNNKSSVFAFLDYGALIKAGPLYRKGLMLEVGIGYKFFASSHIAMVGSISGNFKGLSLTDAGFRTSDRIVVLRGVGVSIGFIF